MVYGGCSTWWVDAASRKTCSGCVLVLQSLWSNSKPMAKTWLLITLLVMVVDVSPKIQRLCSHACWGPGTAAAILDGIVQSWDKNRPETPTLKTMVPKLHSRIICFFLIFVTNIWLKPHRKGRVCFGSQFWGVTVHYGRQAWWWEHEVVDHITSEVEKQRKRNIGF